MNRKIVIPTTLFILVFAFASFALSQKHQLSENQNAQPVGGQTAQPAGDQTAQPAGDQTAQPAGDQTALPVESIIPLFYSDGCSHCALVEQYIQDNHIQDQVFLSKKKFIIIRIITKNL